MLPKRPFGSVTDCNLMPWILFWPLYTTLYRSPGLEIALTVPSMNPKQLPKAAPLTEIASAYICKETGQDTVIPVSYLAVAGIV